MKVADAAEKEAFGSDTDDSKTTESDQAPPTKRTIKKDNALQVAKTKKARVAKLMIEGCWAECGVKDAREIYLTQ